MDVNRLWRALAHHWQVALVVLALVLAAAGYFAYTPPNDYAATSTLSVVPRATGGSDYFGDVQAVTFLMPSLQAQLQTQELADHATQRLPPALRTVVVTPSSTVQPGTGILVVTVESTDRAAVVAATNAYAQSLITDQPGEGPIRITVLDPARAPAQLVGPPRTTTMLSGGVLGLMLAVIAALLAQWWSQRRQVAAVIRERLGLTVLGQIPRSSRLRGRMVNPAEMFESDDAHAVEAYMRLRTNVEIQVTRNKLTTVTVTSRGVGDGKSTVASSLAWALAAVGHRVSLIEADLRRPSLRPRFGAAPAQLPMRVPVGAGDGSELAVYTADGVRRSHAMQGTVASQHPADIVAAVIPTLLGEVASPTGIILVDSPPILGAAESKLLVSATDAAIVVVDARSRNLLEDLVDTVQQIHDAGGSVLGVVVNRARMSRRQMRKISEYYIAPPAVRLPAEPVSQRLRDRALEAP